jgi:hypothetical protein
VTDFHSIDRMQQKQNDSRRLFLQAMVEQHGLAEAGVALSEFARQQELELRIVQDLAVEPECLPALNICRQVSLQTIWEFAALWDQRHAIMRRLASGKTPDEVVALVSEIFVWEP